MTFYSLILYKDVRHKQAFFKRLKPITMKKTILTFIAFLAISFSTITAQNSGLIIGVTGGTAYSKISTTSDFAIDGEDFSRVLKFNGGIDLGFRYGGFSFLTGAHYIQRGYKSKLVRRNPNDAWVLPNGNFDTGSIIDKTSFANISIPLFLRYETKGEAISFSLTMGPLINKGIGKITSKYTYKLDNNELAPEEDKGSFGEGGNDILKPTSVSFYFSPGVLFNIGDNGKFKVNLVAESGANMGNKNYNIVDALGQLRNAVGSIKNSRLGIEIGYEHRISFNMGSKY